MRLYFVIFLNFYAVMLSAQQEIKQFIFGHSLIDHRPPAIPTPSNETTVPHWLFLLSEEANHDYAATGQYGFLQQHMNLPPFAQWGYDIVPAVWDSDNEPFDAVGFNNALITVGNFMQWQGPSVPYFNDPNGTSPISATRSITDWLNTQEQDIRIYIYENWPDMAPYLVSFPPSDAELLSYHDYTLGSFHDWWIEYHDSLLIQRPEQEIKMIPVGPILAELILETEVGEITVTELYEDDAPHGRSTLYFLASLITYMAIYEEKAPSSFVVPPIIDPIVSEHYQKIVDFIWGRLLLFDNEIGDSRVFFDSGLSSTDIGIEAFKIVVTPNPSKGIFSIKGKTQDCLIEVLNNQGQILETFINQVDITVDLTSLSDGLFFVRIRNKEELIGFQKIIKN